MKKNISVFAQAMFDCAMELLYHTEGLSDIEAGREFLAFPRGKHDDILDSIWMASNFGFRPPKRKNSNVSEQNVAKNGGRLSWMVV